MMDPNLSSMIIEGVNPQPDKWPAGGKHTLKKERKVYPGELKKLAE